MTVEQTEPAAKTGIFRIEDTGDPGDGAFWLPLPVIQLSIAGI